MSGTTAPPNTGFGFTYALPIVLDGLMAPAGSMMIVENPEAHLHPRAQSNMGYFLGRMAAAGVRIIVETWGCRRTTSPSISSMNLSRETPGKRPWK